MALITAIPSVNFAGNFPDLEIGAEEDVNIQLVRGPYIENVVIMDHNADGGNIHVGDILTGQTSNAKGIVYEDDPASFYIVGQIGSTPFQLEEVVKNQNNFGTTITGLVDDPGHEYDQFRLLDETYTPDPDGKVLLELREFFEEMFEPSLPPAEYSIYDQTSAYSEFTLRITEVEETEYHSFYVIKGGVNSVPEDDPAFIKEHFLTWQEPAKYIKATDPEWLSYFSQEQINILAKGYFANGNFQTKTLHTLEANRLWSINMNYQHLAVQFDAPPTHIDIWVEDDGNTPITGVQRYVLSTEHFDFDDLFIFSNSLGGLDTIRFTGVRERIERFQFDSALFHRDTLDYHVEADRQYQKNTGDFRSRHHLLWARDFFASLRKYSFDLGQFFRIRTQSDNLPSIRYSVNSYTFTYIESRQTPYQNYFEMNPGEIPDPGEVAYIKTPEGEFVLSPEGQKLEFY